MVELELYCDKKNRWCDNHITGFFS